MFFLHSRRLWSLLSLGFAFSVSLVTTTPALPDLYGDLDSDGEVTSADLVRLINHISGIETLPSELLPFANADRVSGVDAGDIDWIIRSLLGEVGLFAVNPSVSFSSSFGSVDEGDATAAIEVNLHGYTAGSTLSYVIGAGGATPGVDHVNLSGTLAFAGSSLSIPIGMVDDLEREGIEWIDITLTSATGYAVELPSRQRVFIQDNDRLWRGQMSLDGTALAFEMEIAKVGDNPVAGRLVSDGTGTLPQGVFDFVDLVFNATEFTAEVEPINLGAGETFFGVPFERKFTFTNIVPNAANGPIQENPGLIIGSFNEEYDSIAAPYLNFTQSGTFILSEVPDPTPDVDVDLVVVP